MGEAEEAGWANEERWGRRTRRVEPSGSLIVVFQFFPSLFLKVHFGWHWVVLGAS